MPPECWCSPGYPWSPRSSARRRPQRRPIFRLRAARIRTTSPPRRDPAARCTTRRRRPASSASSIRRRASTRKSRSARDSAPHGVIVGPDGAPWITDGGQNAIVRVDPATRAVQRWPLPADVDYANLNTLTFDAQGRVWFTGQSGYYGRARSGDRRHEGVAARRAAAARTASRRRRAARSTTRRSPAITSRASTGDRRGDGDRAADAATRARAACGPIRRGRIWVSYWNTGQVGMYDPATGAWREWKLPGSAHAYSVWVDPDDRVWLTEWSTNAIVRFDPVTGEFESFPSNREQANVRQMLGPRRRGLGRGIGHRPARAHRYALSRPRFRSNAAESSAAATAGDDAQPAARAGMHRRIIAGIGTVVLRLRLRRRRSRPLWRGRHTLPSDSRSTNTEYDG